MAESRIKLDASAFLDSAPAQALASIATEDARAIVERYLTACYDELGKAPHLMDGGEVHGVLGHLLPAHFRRKDPLAPQVLPVLRAFYEHLSGRHLMSQLYEIRRALEETAPEFEQAVETGEAVHHHHHAPEQPFVHQADKVGRNDPCPCGSGKKFKKCCAALGKD